LRDGLIVIITAVIAAGSIVDGANTHKDWLPSTFAVLIMEFA
jgi:hypothetical protein